MAETPEWIYYASLIVFAVATWLLVWELSRNPGAAFAAVSAATAALLLVRLPR